MLTSKRWLHILEDIRAPQAARIAAGLPLEKPEEEAGEGAMLQALDATMKDVKPKEEGDEADQAPSAAGFDMLNVMYNYDSGC